MTTLPTLEILKQNRDAILLAELAGLLHNIGKLDPNFLASMVNDKTHAKEIVKSNWLDIPDYCFDRFVTPDSDLLIEDIRDAIVNNNWNSRAEMAQTLQGRFNDLMSTSAINELIQNWDDAQKKHPFIAKQLEAIWRFYTFINSNGPLYQCLTSHRQATLQPLEEIYRRTQTDYDNFDINIVPPRERQTQHQALQTACTEAERHLKQARQAIIQSETETQKNLEDEFQELTLTVVNSQQPIGQLLTLFWDDFFYKPGGDDYQRESALLPWLNSNVDISLSMLLILSHGEMSGSEKSSQQTSNRIQRQTPNWDDLRISTAFGYETRFNLWGLHESRKRLLTAALSVETQEKSKKWAAFLQSANRILNDGLGDTQRPINEITLWDYASSIAALFKTSIAKSFLEGAIADANQMRWRLLGVRFDGLDYILQATRIADLLGRQQQFQEALNQICLTLTQEIPIASQVYQDENGLFFVVPDSHKLRLEDLQTLIDEQLEQKQFEDLRPHVDWSENPLRGKQLNLGQEIKRQDEVRRPPIDPKKVEEWWRNSTTENCTVCGLRPTISRETNYCFTCKNNRQSRVQTWLNDFNSTIWLNEVADSNGRLALLTGQFPLNHWLDGTLVESLALGMDETTGQPVSKFASFPRVQRIWRTTQTFWQESQAGINSTLTDSRRRLKINLTNTPGLTTHQTYELDLRGQTRMSVLWDGSHLVSIGNLSYIAIQLAIKPDNRTTPADAALAVGVWLEENKQNVFQLLSDDEKNRRFDIQIADVDYQDNQYATTIPILAEPRTFMALVPADRALEVVKAIKAKYQNEMGKVRNRLPLHLGCVYTHRRMPLYAVLDTARAMLSAPLKEENWEVAQDVANSQVQFKNGLTWNVPTVMGDGVTEDVWYPYFQLAGGPAAHHTRRFMGPNGEHWVHVNDLKQDDTVHLTPSTFDFEWLDAASRRFGIDYDDKGRRLARPSRPFYLEDLDHLEALWGCYLSKLSRTQLKQILQTIETTRERWFGRDLAGKSTTDATFKQLVADTLANAQWPKDQRWKDICDARRCQLIAAGVRGELADWAELHLEILKEKNEQSKQTEGETR